MKRGFYTRKLCIERLELWLSAEEALATSQSYKIGTREIRRADLPEVRKQIEFWENKLSTVENKGNRRRTWRAVPRDL